MSDTSQPRPTVLYVDDEEMACKYFARAVGNEYEVLSATSADGAMAVLHAHHAQISILVTDFRMPGRDGGDLLRQVSQEYPHIVRLLVTAYADKDMLLKTVNSGEVFRILEKPLAVAEIRDVLRLAGERHRERAVRQQRLMAIDETLAFLAHELNTPLAAIANFARGIGSRVAGEYSPQRNAEIGHAAGAMHDNAQYCLAVLSSFLQSVRSSAGTVAPKPGVGQEVSAGALVASLLDTYPFADNQRDWCKLSCMAISGANAAKLRGAGAVVCHEQRAAGAGRRAHAGAALRGGGRRAPRDPYCRQWPGHSPGSDGPAARGPGHDARGGRRQRHGHDLLQPRDAVIRRRHPHCVGNRGRHHRYPRLPKFQESYAQE